MSNLIWTMAAKTGALRIGRLLLLACLIGLAVLTAPPCRADLALGIDISPSSPAMDKVAGGPFMASVLPTIARSVAAMKPGERLVVYRISSNQVVDVPLLDKRIQRVRTADGDTAAAYAQSLPRFVAEHIERYRLAPPSGQSHLTAAVANARNMVRTGQPCHLVLISDLIEWDSSGLQYPRDIAKPLPRNPRLNLKGCSVTAYGAGQHLSPKQSQALLGHWETWLKAAGADSVDLRRF